MINVEKIKINGEEFIIIDKRYFEGDLYKLCESYRYGEDIGATILKNDKVVMTNYYDNLEIYIDEEVREY